MPVDTFTMNILLTSNTREYAPVATLTAPGKCEYAVRHGFTFIANHLPDDCRLPRMEQLLPLLVGTEGWVCFTGADTLITNHTIPFTSLCEHTSADFVICDDVLGWNNDVCLLRRGDASRAYIEQVIRLMKRHNLNDQQAMVQAKDSIHHEVKHQRVMNSYLYSEYPHHASDKVWGSSGTWQPGDLILHFPGMPNSRRLRLLPEYLPRVVR